MPDWFYVGAAYGLTWLVLAGYAIYVSRRSRQAEAAAAGLIDQEGDV